MPRTARASHRAASGKTAEPAPTRPDGPSDPSPWVLRFAGLVPAGRSVLDVACGSGRHTRLFLDKGYPVVAVDIDLAGVADLRGHPAATLIAADLETAPWPFSGQLFGGIVVTNYLWRPLLPLMIECIRPGGVLIYDTFAVGQERFGKPRNPDHLLRPGELLEAVRGRLTVRAYEHGEVAEPKPAVRQRICAVNDST